MAPSSTNFITIQSFFSALTTNGVSGNVKADIVSGSGPYTEQVTVGAISGASAANTITLNGSNEVLTFAATNSTEKHTLRFNGATYVTVKNLVIAATGTQFAWGVHFTGNAENNVLDNCVVKVDKWNSSNRLDAIGVVVSATSGNPFTTGDAARNITVIGCAIVGDSATGMAYGIWLNPRLNSANTANINILHCRVEDFLTAGIHLTNCRAVKIQNNQFLRPKRKNTDDVYGIRLINSNSYDTIISNRFYNFFMSSSTSLKQFYGIYIENSLGNLVVANNAIYNNNNNGLWFGIYSACSETTKISHNTISADDGSNTLGTTYGFYHDNATCNKAAGTEFTNNIISITRGGNQPRYGIYQNSSAITINNNNLFLNGINGYIGWQGGTAYKTLAAWQAASGSGAPFDKNSESAAPNFVDVNAGILLPRAVAIDNIGYAAGITNDISNTIRSTTTPDPGAYEFSIDITLLRIVPSRLTTCLGQNDSLTLWVKNNALYALSGFELGYTLNTQPEVLEVFRGVLNPSDSVAFTFATRLNYAVAGNYSIRARIKGKSQQGPVNVFVHPLPSAVKISPAPNFKGFFNGGDEIDPDILPLNDTSTYLLNAPVGYTNSNYGTAWQLTQVATSVKNSTKTIPVADTATKVPTPTESAKFLLRPSATLASETILYSLRVSDFATGCISLPTIREMRIVEKPKANFTVNNVCQKQTVTITNNSLGSGILTYKWFFGDGDSSFATQPHKAYNNGGIYTIVLYVYNEHGFFDSVSKIITVFKNPEVDFTFTNQCSGAAIAFNDKTTLFAGFPSYDWDFGDAFGLSSAKNPSYLYTTPGVYNAVLIVTDAFGCKGTASKQVTFSTKPKADFSFPNLACNQTNVSFTNNSTGQGNLGFTWFLGNGDSMAGRHIDYKYTQAKTYTVRLVALNAFNCSDTAVKTVVLKASPVPGFVPSSTCAMQNIFFDNTTQEPTNGKVSYFWNFGNGDSSAQKSPVYKYTGVGNYTIELVAKDSNGCNASIKNSFTITQKPTADFVVPQNICSKFSFNIKNNTIPSNGTVSYRWSLRDTTTTQESPVISFAQGGNYLIKLEAFTSVGCIDVISKTIQVIETPNSNFFINTAGTADGTMVLTPFESNGQGNYNWVFSAGGSSSSKTAFSHTFSNNGNNSVFLQRDNNGCQSTTSKNIYINPLSVQNVDNKYFIELYPNPSNGNFTIQSSENDKIKSISIYNNLGQLVYNELINRFLCNIAPSTIINNGLYRVLVVTETKVVTLPLQIIK